MLSISGNSKQSTLPASGVITHLNAGSYVKQAFTCELNKYDLVQVLGTGFSARVFSARRYNNINGQRVFHSACAIKVVSRYALGESHKDITSNEAEVLLKLRDTGSSSFVQLEETMADPINRYLVMECLDGGSLYNLMERECGPLDPTFVRIITAELVNALLHLKKHEVVHRDIKPENVLLSARGRAVLADFGVAIDLSSTEDGRARGACGTPGYMAPEVMLRLPYSYEVDMFSMGCTLYHLLVGYSPFEATDYDECARLTFAGKIKYPEVKGMCFYTKHFLSSVMENSQTKRLAIEDAKDTAYLEGIDWQRVEKGDYELPEEWMPPSLDPVQGDALDKQVLEDVFDGPRSPWPVDADEINFITPLHDHVGRRVREEAEIAASSLTSKLELDASLLFAMPEDDLPEEFLQNASSNGFGLSGFGCESGLSGLSSEQTSLHSPVQFMGGWPAFECDISDGYSQSSAQLHPALLPAEPIRTTINDLTTSWPETDLATEDAMCIDSPYFEESKQSPLFVPRTIPDPFGEIPAHFTEEQVRACEADLIYIREFCVQRGIRGLGLRNVPELALTMSTVELVSAPVTPYCSWWPPVEPIEYESYSPEPSYSVHTLSFGGKMKKIWTDLGRAVKRALGDIE